MNLSVKHTSIILYDQWGTLIKSSSMTISLYSFISLNNINEPLPLYETGRNFHFLEATEFLGGGVITKKEGTNFFCEIHGGWKGGC